MKCQLQRAAKARLTFFLMGIVITRTVGALFFLCWTPLVLLRIVVVNLFSNTYSCRIYWFVGKIRLEVRFAQGWKSILSRCLSDVGYYTVHVNGLVDTDCVSTFYFMAPLAGCPSIRFIAAVAGHVSQCLLDDQRASARWRCNFSRSIPQETM